MREDYRGVTDETKAAVEDFVKEIAYEMDVEPQYLYAILSGKESDPFKKFKRVFRAVARKNPNGARGYIAKLSSILREEEPRKSEAVGIGAALRTFGDMCAVAAELDDGLCAPEKFEDAKQRHVEIAKEVTVYAPANHIRNAG
jgi:hypothetical protein